MVIAYYTEQKYREPQSKWLSGSMLVKLISFLKTHGRPHSQKNRIMYNLMRMVEKNEVNLHKYLTIDRQRELLELIDVSSKKPKVKVSRKEVEQVLSTIRSGTRVSFKHRRLHRVQTNIEQGKVILTDFVSHQEAQEILNFFESHPPKTCKKYSDSDLITLTSLLEQGKRPKRRKDYRLYWLLRAIEDEQIDPKKFNPMLFAWCKQYTIDNPHSKIEKFSTRDYKELINYLNTSGRPTTAKNSRLYTLLRGIEKGKYNVGQFLSHQEIKKLHELIQTHKPRVNQPYTRCDFTTLIALLSQGKKPHHKQQPRLYNLLSKIKHNKLDLVKYIDRDTKQKLTQYLE